MGLRNGKEPLGVMVKQVGLDYDCELRREEAEEEGKGKRGKREMRGLLQSFSV